MTHNNNSNNNNAPYLATTSQPVAIPLAPVPAPTYPTRFGVSPTHDGVYYPEDDESGGSFPPAIKARLDAAAPNHPTASPQAHDGVVYPGQEAADEPTVEHHSEPAHLTADAQPGLHKKGHHEPTRDGGVGGAGDEHSHTGQGHDSVHYIEGERGCNFAPKV
ncbi:uncharacterized protein EHS24_003918 [Apiotrichum porosum]|uniref:Uncharacterized protein n=1 Tax=Apiotrichum porosum TaxID=105984 RepID=A0A427XDK6_9TREE|nr:uncharacterized protein EHS24_003918 [Apiotrichum porosum]RSH76979.1 hypothetical protein EHS24_003918 [Apiotrichum porosum]